MSGKEVFEKLYLSKSFFFFFNGDKCVSASSPKKKSTKTINSPYVTLAKENRLKSLAALLSSLALLLPTAPCQNPAAPAQCNISVQITESFG